MENTVVKNAITEATKMKISQLVRNKEDIQKLRIGCGNRIVASFNAQLGQKPSTKQEDMTDEENLKMIKILKKEYDRITDGYVSNKVSLKQQMKNMEGELKYIKDQIDYDLMDEYASLLKAEEKNMKALKSVVHQHPLWDAFFKDVKGCGEATAAVCIAYFDPYKARHAASFWAYAGLNPVDRIDTEGNIIREANSKKYTREYEYTDTDGNVKTKKGITYNPTLKTALLGVAAPCFLKACLRTDKETGYKIAEGPYVNAYCDYKGRQTIKHPDYSSIHIEKMSVRYMMRNFVRDMWVAWRKLEGLPVTIPYEEEFLGRAPHKWPNLATYEPVKPVEK